VLAMETSSDDWSARTCSTRTSISRLRGATSIYVSDAEKSEAVAAVIDLARYREAMGR
jgi:hypothetical protein